MFFRILKISFCLGKILEFKYLIYNNIDIVLFIFFFLVYVLIFFFFVF